MVFIILIGFPLQDVGELKLGIDISRRQCRSPTVQCWESEVTWTQWSLCMLLVCLSRKCNVQSLHFEDCFTLPIYQMGTNLTFCPGFFPSLKYQTLCRAPFQWKEATPTFTGFHTMRTWPHIPSQPCCVSMSPFFCCQSLKLSNRLEATRAPEGPYFLIREFRTLCLILLFQPWNTPCLGAHNAAGPWGAAAGIWKPPQLVSLPVSTHFFPYFVKFLKVLVIVYIGPCVWCPTG